MKTNELMIGNWVRITDDDTNTHFDAKVEAIDWVGNVYVKASGDETAYPYSADCVKPIPLTSEILEKNGFKKVKYGYEWKERISGYIGQTTSSTTPVIITYYNEGHCAVSNSHIGRMFQGSIDSVYELQHALQLCGIEIEIKL